MKNRLKFMLVDDEQHVIDYVSELIVELGMIVSGVALNGEETLKKLPAAEPDIVLLDVTMPGMLGSDLITEVKKFNNDIKVVMLSSRNTNNVIQVCIDNGATGYILKSQGPEYITEKILELSESITQR